MENRTLTALAKKINEAISERKGGLSIDDSHLINLGSDIFVSIFGADFGALEAIGCLPLTTDNNSHNIKDM